MLVQAIREQIGLEIPFIHLDCGTLTPTNCSQSIALQMEVAQNGILLLENIDRLPGDKVGEVLQPYFDSLPESRRGKITLISTVISLDEIIRDYLALSYGMKHQLRVPSLAERRKDIPELAALFVKEATGVGVSPEPFRNAIDKILAHCKTVAKLRADIIGELTVVKIKSGEKPS